MADLVKLAQELILKNHPEQISSLFGLSVKISKLVFALRMRKGMTQNELAEILNVDPKIIHRIEGGSKCISIDEYEKALFALGVSYEEMNELINYQVTEERLEKEGETQMIKASDVFEVTQKVEIILDCAFKGYIGELTFVSDDSLQVEVSFTHSLSGGDDRECTSYFRGFATDIEAKENLKWQDD